MAQKLKVDELLNPEHRRELVEQLPTLTIDAARAWLRDRGYKPPSRSSVHKWMQATRADPSRHTREAAHKMLDDLPPVKVPEAAQLLQQLLS
jgi:hypothetical protein